MRRVQVLLSSYNGEKYIKQQLDSILNQKGVEIHCLVRDDGSTDQTTNILLQYQKRYNNIKVVFGSNIGYKASFMELVYLSGQYDYYAFADQDDVWQTDKLLKAIEEIEKVENDLPVMYCSNCTVVDENLNYMQMLHKEKNIVPNKIRALVEGFAHGCTMVFNHKAKDLIIKYRLQQDLAHDFWIPLLMLFCGKVIYDNNSYILYRQHSNNVFGNKSSLKRVIKSSYDRFKSKGYYSKIIQQILDGYSDDLTIEDYKLLNEIKGYNISFSRKVKLLFNKQLKKRTIRGTFYLRVLIILSRF